jgi:hypothetical protein
MIKLVPEKIVGYNEVDEPLFTLECYDDQAARLQLHDDLIYPDSWPEIAAAVQRALHELYPTIAAV